MQHSCFCGGAACKAPSWLTFTACLLRPQVVCEEAEDAGWSKRTGRNKSRFIAGVVTPAKPHYLYGLVEAEGDTQFGSSSSLPVVGELQAGAC